MPVTQASKTSPTDFQALPGHQGAPPGTNPTARHITNPVFRGVHPMHSGLLVDNRGEMASARIKLDPQATEAIARKVVELLERRGLQKRELVDAVELARRFGIERSWVYSHAIELGAVKLGSGVKPRLRFDPEIAAKVLQKAGEGSAADPPARSGERAGQPQRGRGSDVPLLPFGGQDDSAA
jgi:hypothetical protein